MRELNDMRQSWEVSKLQILITGNVVERSDSSKHLGLFNGIYSEVGLEIEVQVKHVFGIPGFLHDESENALLYGIVSGLRGGYDRC